MPHELKITSKGQLTLRKAVLNHLRVKPGEKVGIALLPEGRVELRPATETPDIQALRGLLRRPGQQAASLDEMQDAIESVDMP
jgi:bifunctional DNA-binding transcriptional regulator/antitoxin component of YhaV-PrlF toxin-antitoxin module